MQFTTALTLLVAAAGINAAAVEKRVSAIPLSIFAGSGCNSSPTAISTAYVPTDGSCFPVTYIFSAATVSGLIDQTLLKTLPAGCSLIAYSDSTCSSVNNLPYAATGQCATFGPGKIISSARTVGKCA